MSLIKKWKKRIIKRSPFFTLSHSLLSSKIAAPIPVWVEARIEEDLAPYVKSGLSIQKVENTLQKTKETGNWEAAKLYRIVIRSNRLLSPKGRDLMREPRIVKLALFFRTLLRVLPIPDVDFLISTSDIYENSTFLECQEVPVFFISKTVANRHACLFPHIVWLSYWSYLRQQFDLLSANRFWEQREERLFWRGATTGFDIHHCNFTREKVVELSQNYPEEVDAAFSNLVQVDKHQKYFETKPISEPEEQIHYKYLLALDGNCFPGSFFWQLASGSVVFKNDSPFLEWYYGGLKPFIHYIPFAQDGSDLLERKRWAQTHDAQVKSCAANAKAFANEHLTNEGIATFVYHLLKRYAQLF